MDKLFSKMHYFELTVVASLIIAFLTILLGATIEANLFVKVKNDTVILLSALNGFNTFILASYVMYKAMKHI